MKGDSMSVDREYRELELAKLDVSTAKLHRFTATWMLPLGLLFIALSVYSGEVLESMGLAATSGVLAVFTCIAGGIWSAVYWLADDAPGPRDLVVARCELDKAQNAYSKAIMESL